VRSHVDWGEGDQPPLAWHVLGDLARDRTGALTLELAPLIRLGLFGDAAQAGRIAQIVARTGGTLGAYVFDQPNRAAALARVFEQADRFGLALDFHVDEGLADGLDGLELIADAALATGFGGPVLCGHACSLMNLEGDALVRVLDKLAAAGIAVAALPTTNLYLQGRGPGTPDRRGLTRLRELHAAGVSIVVGSDNVADAFCPLGQHDPMAALHLAVLAAHLDPPLDRWLALITANAARALGRAPVTVLGAQLRDLRLSPARTLAELIAGTAPPPAPLNLHMEPLTA
jgi:cytosine deaminase